MEQASLFQIQNDNRPLADKMRPLNFNDYVGQKHLVSKGSLLYEMISQDKLSSMIFWGPPGVGKTTLAKIIANMTSSYFITYSAVTSSIKEIKEVMKLADERILMGQKTILFIDEIHRFNKSQQDAFLPYVEKGSIILIGATTENPSFEINNALLSRCKVFILKNLEYDDLKELIYKAINQEYHDYQINLDDNTINAIIDYAHGDARTLLNTLELFIDNSPRDNNIINISHQILKDCLGYKSIKYDKNADEHYNIISALHKSMRNFDVQASIYWLARMIEGGEDPLYIARRIVRFASEDIGMADSKALEIAINAYDACRYLGYPECNVHLTHAVTYCALAPKSNALYVAYNKASNDAKKTSHIGVPLHLRNAPTKLMKDLGYAKGYEYSQNYENHMTDMECIIDELKGSEYYTPSNQGVEVKVKERMQKINEIKNNLKKEKK